MATFTWVKFTGGELPANLLVAGNRYNGETLNICRVEYEGMVIPGKFWTIGKKAYFPYDGKEVKVVECELLTCDKPDLVEWVSATSGKIANGSIAAGHEAHGGATYLGRGKQSNELIPGKIDPTRNACFVSTQNKEWDLSEYEVLVCKSFSSLTTA